MCVVNVLSCDPGQRGNAVSSAACMMCVAEQYLSGSVVSTVPASKVASSRPASCSTAGKQCWSHPAVEQCFGAVRPVGRFEV
jgi:hypothetical protein